MHKPVVRTYAVAGIRIIPEHNNSYCYRAQ